MSSTPTRCIALTKELDAYIQAQVASGHYKTASEVVRAALRLLIEREDTRPNGQSSVGPATPLHASSASAL